MLDACRNSNASFRMASNVHSISEKGQRYNLLPRFGHLQDDPVESPES